MAEGPPWTRVKTLRLHLPVLANDDVDAYLDLVTRVPGVVATLVDTASPRLEVIVATDAVALLVERQVKDALLAEAAGRAIP
jgi:hypothetical protein